MTSILWDTAFQDTLFSPLSNSLVNIYIRVGCNLSPLLTLLYLTFDLLLAIQ